MIWPFARKKKANGVDGLVYQVPGPDGPGYRWIARSIYGHVAHGVTAADAAENLRAGMEALASASGQSFDAWARTQASGRSMVLRAGELVQA